MVKADCKFLRRGSSSKVVQYVIERQLSYFL